MQWLRLRDTQVSDAGLKHLCGLKNLWYLNLDGTRVSDVSAFEGLTNLLTLDLRGTQVSDVSALEGLTNPLPGQDQQAIIGIQQRKGCNET